MKTITVKLFLITCLSTLSFQYSFSQLKQKNKAKNYQNISIHLQGNDTEISKGFWSIERNRYGAILQLSNSKGTELSFKSNSFFVSFYLSDNELDVINKSSNSFSLARASGVITFISDNANEQGTYAFNVNNEFESFLKKEGINEVSDYHFLKLFLGNIDRDYVLGLKKHGYQPTINQLVKMGLLGLDLEYVNSILETNYKGLELNMLTKFFIHGIEKQYIEELTALGYGNIDANMMKKFAIHGVSSNYVKGLQELGYSDLEANMIKNFAIHGISVDYIKGLQDVGYADLDADMIKKYAIHGISVNYIRGLNDLGYKNLDPNTIKNFAIHGVSIKYIKSLMDLNINKPTTTEIKKATIHGVTANFVERAMKKGYNEKDLSYYTKLKIHGI